LKLIYRYIIAVLFFINFEVEAQDLTPPDAPTIDSVTVKWENPNNINGDVLITWQKSDSTDVRSYYIKYLNEALGTYKFLDSVDANTNSYLDTKEVTNPHRPQTYVVQAVDSANNTSSHSLPHKTVRVFPIQKEENCKIKVELTWNLYEGWNEGIEYFDLYSVEDSVHHYVATRYDNSRAHSYRRNDPPRRVHHKRQVTKRRDFRRMSRCTVWLSQRRCRLFPCGCISAF
jgi:hypothetical protein